MNGKFVWPQGIAPLAPVDMRTVEHCPIDDKNTLVDGKTIGVAYPQPGWNCFPSFGNYAQHQGDNTQVNGKFVWPQGITPHAPVDMRSVEHCPIDDKVTLVDGKTIGVPYPQQGWNCFPSFGNY